MKIMTVRHIHSQLFPNKPPTAASAGQCYKVAAEKGIHLDRNGRGFVPWKATPKGFRWQNERLISRKSA